METTAHVAHVKGGRLVLDEPTDLPEGTAVELYEAQDELDEEELKRLDEALQRAEEDVEADRTVSHEELIRQLRSSR
jgi:hypothetical protein